MKQLCAKGRRKKIWGPSEGQLPVKNVAVFRTSMDRDLFLTFVHFDIWYVSAGAFKVSDLNSFFYWFAFES